MILRISPSAEIQKKSYRELVSLYVQIITNDRKE